MRTYSIDDLLELVVAHKASDLHLTAGTNPAIRVHGEIQRLDEIEPLRPEDTQQLMYQILSSEQQKDFEIKRQLDFAHGVPGLARFRVNVYFQRGSVGAAFRLIPEAIKTLEELGLPASLHQLAEKPRGLVLVTGPTGFGEVDDARVADRRGEPNPLRPHPHDRGPDRVRAPPQAVRRQPARDRHGRVELRGGAAGGIAPGPRRDPRRRAARPRDDRRGADRGGDGPPRPRDAAHAERVEHGRPHHRRLPAGAAGAGTHAARRLAAGDRHAGAAPDRERRRPRRRPRDPSARRCHAGT